MMRIRRAKDWLAGHLREYIRDPAPLAELARTIHMLARPNATDELVKIARELIEAHEDH